MRTDLGSVARRLSSTQRGSDCINHTGHCGSSPVYDFQESLSFFVLTIPGGRPPAPLVPGRPSQRSEPSRWGRRHYTRGNSGWTWYPSVRGQWPAFMPPSPHPLLPPPAGGLVDQGAQSAAAPAQPLSAPAAKPTPPAGAEPAGGAQSPVPPGGPVAVQRAAGVAVGAQAQPAAQPAVPAKGPPPGVSSKAKPPGVGELLQTAPKEVVDWICYPKGRPAALAEEPSPAESAQAKSHESKHRKMPRLQSRSTSRQRSTQPRAAQVGHESELSPEQDVDVPPPPRGSLQPMRS